MMKKPHLFSVTNRPLTSTNKKNTLYNTLGNSNNKNTI